jgi:hypothetical protein
LTAVVQLRSRKSLLTSRGGKLLRLGPLFTSQKAIQKGWYYYTMFFHKMSPL